MSAIIKQNVWRGVQRRDPWWKAEQWRYEHPLVATKYLWRGALPGFGWASVAFAGYCTAEWVLGSGDDHGHGHGAAVKKAAPVAVPVAAATAASSTSGGVTVDKKH